MAPVEKLAAIVGVAVALMSVYPGVLTAAMFLAILLIPMAVMAAAFVGVLYGSVYLAWTFLPDLPRKRKIRPRPPAADPDFAVIEARKAEARPASRLIPRIFLAVSLSLWLTGIPRRTGFAISRPAFERCLSDEIPIGRQDRATPRTLGIYRINECWRDPRGGVYFRCSSHPEVIDIVSYGFAHRPNAEGSPFGNSHYALSHLDGDWYVFSASDDW